MKVTAEQLRRFSESPKAFRDALLIDSDSGPRPFSSVMDDWQREDFESMDPAWQKLAGHDVDVPYRRAWLERPRGHSKTCDIAVSCVWVMAFSQRILSGVCAAVDRSQARLLRNAINRIVLLNPWLEPSIDVQHSVVKNPRTGSELEILSSDAPSSFGRTPSFIICDELCHWQGSDLWESLFSAAGKKRDCVLQVITNAGWTESWQFDLRESVRADDGWFFHRLDGPKASWLDQERLAEQKRLLPAPAFDRLWLNRWSSGSGDALSSEDIDRAVRLDGPMRGRERGWIYVAGLDLSVSKDHSALAVVARHLGHSEQKQVEQKPKSDLNSVLVDLGFASAPIVEQPEVYEHVEGTHETKLADLKTWRPPKKGKIDLQQIENAVLYAHDRFGLSGCFFDPFQCEHMAQRLRRRGVKMIPVPFTPSNLQSMASTLIEAYASEYTSVYKHDDLLLQLKRLRIVEKSYGFRLESPRDKTGHGDAVMAYILALFGLKKFRGIPTLARPILHGLDIPEFQIEDDPPFQVPRLT